MKPFKCGCGEMVGYPDCLDHVCDWTCTEPGQAQCEQCGRYVRDNGIVCDGERYCSTVCEAVWPNAMRSLAWIRER